MPVTTTEDSHSSVCDIYRGQSLQCLWHLQYSHSSVCDSYRGLLTTGLPVITTEDSHRHSCGNHWGQSLACLWQLQRTVTGVPVVIVILWPAFLPLGMHGQTWKMVVKGSSQPFLSDLKPIMFSIWALIISCSFKVRKWFSFKMKKWIMFIFVRLNLYGCCTTDQWASYFFLK